MDMFGSQVLMGAFGMYAHRHVLEKRYHYAYLMIAIVGFGSVAFHATLHRHCQMWDEVPMLWSAAITLWIILENESPRGTHAYGSWLPAALFCFCALTTWLNIFSDGDLQFYLFHFTFGPTEMFVRVLFLGVVVAGTVVGLLCVVAFAEVLLVIVSWRSQILSLPYLPTLSSIQRSHV